MLVKSLEYLDDTDGTRLPVTRVELRPHTGRTHQLRVHTAALGYPIVGDDIYWYLGQGDCGIDHSKSELHSESEELHRRIQNL